MRKFEPREPEQLQGILGSPGASCLYIEQPPQISRLAGVGLSGRRLSNDVRRHHRRIHHRRRRRRRRGDHHRGRHHHRDRDHDALQLR
jgi:hypothetical protein